MLQIGTNNREYKKKGKLHYNTKKYSNPFFQNAKNNNHKQNNQLPPKVKIAMYFIFTLLLLLFWFLFYSNYFKISNIQTNGEGRIPMEKIQEIANFTIDNSIFSLSPKRNIFLMKQNKLISNLEKKYTFEFINIEKKYPNSIIINYKEKEYAAIWNEFDKYYYIDESGRIINEANLDDIEKDYPYIINKTEFGIIDGNIGIKSNYVTACLNLYKLLSPYEQEIKIKNFTIDANEFNSIKIYLDAGPILFFDISKNIEKQVDKLLIVKNEKIKDDFLNKEYIDVRTGDHVYFR